MHETRPDRAVAASPEPIALATGIRKEVLWLVALVLALDAVFVAIYFLGQVRSASDSAKLGFTVLWTLAVLMVAIRGLSRIRNARLKSAAKGRSS
jgi:hypothetical protein